jgi:hypothetical protein
MIPKTTISEVHGIQYDWNKNIFFHLGENALDFRKIFHSPLRVLLGVYVELIAGYLYLGEGTHCNVNPIYGFLFCELRGLSPNFHIHVSVIDLYIPTIDLAILLQEICGPILRIYNCSQTHECGNLDCGWAIPFLRIFVSNFRNWFFAVRSTSEDLQTKVMHVLEQMFFITEHRKWITREKRIK